MTLEIMHLEMSIYGRMDPQGSNKHNILDCWNTVDHVTQIEPGAMLEETSGALKAVIRMTSPAVRWLILATSGSIFFSVGAELLEMGEQGPKLGNDTQEETWTAAQTQAHSGAHRRSPYHANSTDPD